MAKLNKVVVVLDEKKINEIAEGKIDKRTLNTGRPVNKKSARQARLAKQAFYADVNRKFKEGNQFVINKGDYATYKYSQPKNNNEYGAIVNEVGCYICNVSYIGRTKVQGYTFVLGKKVNVELNLKTLKFVK